MYLNLGNNICCIIIFSRYNAENSLKINLKIIEFDIKEVAMVLFYLFFYVAKQWDKLSQIIIYFVVHKNIRN
jgi:hypothetical protein